MKYPVHRKLRPLMPGAKLTVRKVLLAAAFAVIALSGSAQTIFNCTDFSTSGCSVSHSAGSAAFVTTGGYPYPLESNGATVNVGPAAVFMPSSDYLDTTPAGHAHDGIGFFYNTPVDVRAFTTTFSWVPNGQNFAFVFQNTNNASGAGYQGVKFNSGAGCEAGMYQSFGGNPETSGSNNGDSAFPNNVFGMDFEGDAFLNPSDGGFTYSSVQIYMSGQSPCSPNDNGPYFWPTTKYSTNPVPLDSPPGAAGRDKTTGDTYAATVTYDGSNLVLSFADASLGNSCPGSSCYTHTWSNVRIPSLVGANTAYVGFTAGINIEHLPQSLITQFAYTVNPLCATTANPANCTPTSMPPSAGAANAANVTFSPGAGTYAGTQNVTLSDATANSYICYTLAPAGLVITPLPDNFTQCAVGTLYTGPVAVTSSQTLYAIAGTNATSAPSGVSQAAYAISGSSTPAATPAFAPAAGTYNNTQSVTISDTTSGSTIYYTTDGSAPTTGSAVYSGAISVSATTTIKAVATAAGFAQSATGSAAYTISPISPAATPTFSPGAGTYSGPQSVTLASTSAGAIICYNTSGSPATNTASGCSTGTLYAGPISVSGSETVYAVAGGTGFNDSAVGSAAYSIQVPAATPTITLASGTYTMPTSTTITDYAGTNLFYCTGAATCPPSTAYTSAVTINTTTTEYVCANGTAAGYTTSNTVCSSYSSNATAATPTFSPGGGSYSGAQSVTISAATGGVICYNLTGSPATDGSAGCTAGTVYSAAIPVASNETIYAVAGGSGYADSPIGSAAYTFSTPAATPTITLATGTYAMPTSTTITDYAGSNIFYCTSTSATCTPATAYSGAITINAAPTLYLCANVTAPGYTTSATSCQTYTAATPSQAATPTFSPGAGSYAGTQSITISDTTSGSTVYYTADGSTPTTGSTVYNSPISVSTTQTIQAIAAATGFTQSPVGSSTYTFSTQAPAPTITLAPGSYTMPQTTTIIGSSGFTVYYCSGSSNCIPGIAYTGAITINTTTSVTICSNATAAGYLPSNTVCNVYSAATSRPSSVLVTGATKFTGRVVIQ